VKRLLLVVALGMAVLAVLAVKELERRWYQPLAIPQQGFALTVAAGDSLRSVVNTLHRDGVLAYPNLVVLYGRWSGLDQQIKRGEYLLPPDLTAESMLALLQSGKVIQYQVTLPEGITLAQALAILSRQNELEQVLQGPDDARILELVKPHGLAEGLFFPDSYHFSRGATDWQVIQRAHRDMLAVLEQEWLDRAPELPYETAYDALIMASIIERETGLPEERQQIAGVFVRRLQQGMRLQTDPTVIYGLGSDYTGNLRRKHLSDDSNPYNSYRHSGLPPGPIALPGRAAIHAALHPAAGNTLYFVARGDGGHVFSATLAEHQQAVRKYQLRRRADYRSTPGKQ
jgi:UPF0755 protein